MSDHLLLLLVLLVVGLCRLCFAAARSRLLLLWRRLLSCCL